MVFLLMKNVDDQELKAKEIPLQKMFIICVI